MNESTPQQPQKTWTDRVSPEMAKHVMSPAATVESANASAAKIPQHTPYTREHVGKVSQTIGNLAYEHRNFVNKNPVGQTGYHFLRSAVAAVPYGLGAAVVWTGKHAALSRVDDRLEKGLISAEKAAMQTGFLKSPIMVAAQIAASFTFYRTGSFTMRRMYERVFDDKNTRADTIKEIQQSPFHFFDDFKSNLSIQATSVPWAALTLGFITSMGAKPSSEAVELAAKDTSQILFHKEANWLPQAAVNTVAYSTFFEAADSLAKHYRLQRGIADPTLPISAQKDKNGDTIFKIDDPNKKYGFFTNDTGAGRLLLRRVLPVAVGIGAYTGAKRLGYRASISSKTAEKMIEGGKPGELFGLAADGSFMQTAWREGAATSLFFLYTLVKDPWEQVYDNFFSKLEKNAKAETVQDEAKMKIHDDEKAPQQPQEQPALHDNERPLTDKAMNNYHQLLETLNAKELSGQSVATR